MGLWNVNPSEFGKLTMHKWWLIYDAKFPVSDGVEGMDEEELDNLMKAF